MARVSGLNEREVKSLRRYLKRLRRGLKDGTIDPFRFDQSLEIIDVPGEHGIMESRHTGVVTISLTFYDVNMNQREREQEILQRRFESLFCD